MLSIDEAIQRENKIAEENQKIVDTQIVFDGVSISQLYCDDTEVIEEHLSNYKKCAEYHKQIAEWLEELKLLREEKSENNLRNRVNNMDGITINEEVLVKLTFKYAKKYGNLPSTHKQAIQFAYEQGKVDAMKEVINNIPCKKNCNVCLRNGMASCYEPEENYVANELFEKITTMIQQAT